MILHEQFYYKLPDGRIERTKHKMSPSNLLRANVPEEMIKAYDIAVTNRQYPKVIHHKNGHREVINEEKIKRDFDEAHNAITEFLRNQEKEHFPDGDFFPKNK